MDSVLTLFCDVFVVVFLGGGVLTMCVGLMFDLVL